MAKKTTKLKQKKPRKQPPTGHELLDALIHDKRLTLATFAETVDVSLAHVSEIRRANALPSLALAIRLEKLHKIPCVSWEGSPLM